MLWDISSTDDLKRYLAWAETFKPRLVVSYPTLFPAGYPEGMISPASGEPEREALPNDASAEANAIAQAYLAERRLKMNEIFKEILEGVTEAEGIRLAQFFKSYQDAGYGERKGTCIICSGTGVQVRKNSSGACTRCFGSGKEKVE